MRALGRCERNIEALQRVQHGPRRALEPQVPVEQQEQPAHNLQQKGFLLWGVVWNLFRLFHGADRAGAPLRSSSSSRPQQPTGGGAHAGKVSRQLGVPLLSNSNGEPPPGCIVITGSASGSKKETRLWRLWQSCPR